MYILGSIHIWPVGLNLFASAHIHPLPARALLVSLKGLSSAYYFFYIHISPISTIAHSHKVCQQQYADDTQLLVALSPVNYNHDISAFQSCLTSLQAWFCESGMALNPSKSVAILFGTPQRLKSVSDLKCITVANTAIPLSDKVKNFGVTLDSNLAMGLHTKALYKSCFYHIRSFRQIRSSLDDAMAASVASAVTNQRSRTPFSSNELLKQLHWLPLEWRIQFKLATLTFKALHTGRPPYLTDLLQHYQSTRSLRSSSSHQLFIPRHNLSLGSRAFSAPRIWNKLHLRIRETHSLPAFKVSK